MAKSVDLFFVLNDEAKEKKAIQKFIDLDLDSIVNKNEGHVKRDRKRKFLLRKKFPFFYKLYKIIIK